ncbi:glycoside hydrolase family 3 protein [Maricaulis sp.]|uniref:glycoside hydrolase family 3 protein n=1 Tax=Maricaulis sp. TaxID=1486257 RepID=UPI001B2259A6|nr:glycoside hydrolase family 3 protein [Maricaulis sp.]MBO6798517.1 glycoside hydrolase family 3 C-terminal domain-containing protein [Maricaulis sp.]
MSLNQSRKATVSGLALSISLSLAACQPAATEPEEESSTANAEPAAQAAVEPVFVDLPASATANPDSWPAIEPLPLDPQVEARIDSVLALMTLEQKVGQVIQADSGSVTAEEVRQYRLGSVLSGGNSAPGPEPYADAETWLAAADDYFNASIDTEGVEIAIPIIWGIDAVHGHANLRGAVVFPHNIGLGAANNPELIEEIYRVTARELSVSGHDWTFAPTLAVPRDDRWGRTYEGFSEDPEIVRAYGERIVWGLQGRPGTDEFMATGRVISSAKHFLADGGTVDGRDQGDAVISEAELRDIHAQGYYSAIPAGVQTVMASFSGWNGIRMHGNHSLLEDVLKDRMGFNGFVIGDWNGHGLIDGCTATDCPESFNAGVDMFMAPDSWQELYYSTLEHVQAGRISMERLDDAVRRILRVKIQSGVFEQVAPSQRPLANDTSVLAAEEHRAVARQAVRESLVLLKNEDNLLPLDPGLTVLVVGDGADSITKTAGGWTLSWQGGGYPNSEFPAGQTILDGIREVVEAAGGSVVFDVEGSGDVEADVVIAVYGEEPYAEFQGDRDHLDFVPNGFDTTRLNAFSEAGTPVVSVFLSGRPLWTNPEINASDAFVAAWLPGTEGGGIADMLFRTDPGFDFTGRLSFSWPASAVAAELNRGDASYAPQFAYGYGLSFSDTSSVGTLSEVSGLSEEDLTPSGSFFLRGQAISPWRVETGLAGEWTAQADGRLTSDAMTLGRTDRISQEDSLQMTWRQPDVGVRLTTEEAFDLSREANGEMELSFRARGFGSTDVWVNVGMTCDSGDACTHSVPIQITQGPWREYRVSLSCFSEAGMDLSRVSSVFELSPDSDEGEIGLGDIVLASDTDAAQTCGDDR